MFAKFIKEKIILAEDAMSAEYTLMVAESLDEVSPDAWQAMDGGNPFVGYHFLRLLQDTGCVSGRKGWYPQYLLLYRNEQLVGAAPCFFKMHSRGEFVFDQGWANAFAQHGLDYYPKLLIASPFTPVQGPRLLAMNAEARAVLARGLRQFCEASKSSSAHALFVKSEDLQVLQQAGFMVREGVQFHWKNDWYDSVESFLLKLSQDKRKKMRQDSRYVKEAGIFYRWLEGNDLHPQHLSFFYACYVQTYVEHHSQPYLTEEFFQRAHAEGTLHFVLILAERDGQPVACALNVRSADTLYGRYWGATEFVRGLHFETCYMQSIAYCIAENIRCFEGGAQGEHKMARGLLPVVTYSAHYVADQRFTAAIADFLEKETIALDSYVENLKPASPFKE